MCEHFMLNVKPVPFCRLPVSCLHILQLRVRLCGAVIAQGLKPNMKFGPTRRLAIFLFGLLQPQTQTRYLSAIAAFMEHCSAIGVSFYDLTEESQDFFLADWLLLSVDDPERAPTLQYQVDLLAGLRKMYAGRRKYKAAFSVISGLQSAHPPVSAPPLQDIVVYAWSTLMISADKAAIGLCGLICFCGLLRIGEALQLRWLDVVLPTQHRAGQFVVIMLKQPKRAALNAEKVYLCNPVVVALIVRFYTKYYLS
ncbi:unnamed protein product [Polarella glacialis]|uniref:Uncharacterized protein n=1 Tax=Polarella glacialis TaxID=89957 RepID=A0A813EXZ2_POLGL|nr:unnamed protein product [Polarella glacialis]